MLRNKSCWLMLASLGMSVYMGCDDTTPPGQIDGTGGDAGAAHAGGAGGSGTGGLSGGMGGQAGGTGCGDSILGETEGCDDGNTMDSDGCSSTCQVEAGFACSGTPSLCCWLEIEPNDSPTDTSVSVPLGTLICAKINPPTDTDHFSLVLPTVGDIVIETFDGMGPGSCVAQDTVVGLFASDGQTLITWDNNSGMDLCDKIDGWVDKKAARLPAGQYYVAVNDYGNNDTFSYTISISATVCGDGKIERSEECDGGPNCDSECQVIAPALGESLQTAEPLLACPLAPKSTVRVGAPNCLPPDGGVHWYSYASAGGVVTLSADAAGPVAFFGPNGELLGCSSDLNQHPLAARSGPGEVFYAALPVGFGGTCLSFKDLPYNGVGDGVSDLNVTLPASVTADQGMAVGSDQIFIGTFTRIIAFPKSGNAMAVEHGAADGLGIAHFGNDIALANGSLFSLDNTSNESTSRLFRVFEEQPPAWGPTAWDTNPAYPPSLPSYALAFDGLNLIYSNRGDDITLESHFYLRAPDVPGPAQLLTTLTGFTAISGLAADAQFLYMVGDSPVQGRGVYRINRGDFNKPPTLVTAINTFFGTAAIVVDDLVSAKYLYVRDAEGDTHAVADPGGEALYLGVLNDLGTTGDRAMAFDPVDNSIYLFETETSAAGRVVKLQ